MVVHYYVLKNLAKALSYHHAMLFKDSEHQRRIENWENVNCGMEIHFDVLLSFVFTSVYVVV